MKIQLFNNTKKKKFTEQVSYLGIEKMPWLLAKTGKESVNAFSGSLSTDEIMEFWRNFHVEGFGLYMGKQMIDKKTGQIQSRLSIDALHFLHPQISKNIIPLNKEQLKKWWQGKNLEVLPEQVKNITGGEFVAISDNEDLIGTAKLSHDKTQILSFLPKERRVKN